LHNCVGVCSRCEDAEKTLQIKRKHQQEEEARLLQEKYLERLVRIENTVAAIQRLDWGSQIEETIHLQNREVLRQQAEILLSALCGGKHLLSVL